MKSNVWDLFKNLSEFDLNSEWRDLVVKRSADCMKRLSDYPRTSSYK